MKTIWKFALETTDVQTIRMPKNADIFKTAQVQFDRICVWAAVDPEATMEDREFHIMGTGHPMGDLSPANSTLLGTVQLADGALVFHVFVK